MLVTMKSNTVLIYCSKYFCQFYCLGYSGVKDAKGGTCSKMDKQDLVENIQQVDKFKILKNRCVCVQLECEVIRLNEKAVLLCSV